MIAPRLPRAKKPVFARSGKEANKALSLGVVNLWLTSGGEKVQSGKSVWR
jgi:hypothetical protein